MRGAGALMSPVQRGVVLAGLGWARSRVAAFVAVTALGSTCAIASPLILAGIVQRPDRPATTVAAALAAYAVAVAAARFLYDVRMVLANAVEQRVATTADGTVLRSLLGADGSLAVAYNPARIASVVASFHRSNKMLVQILLMAFLGGLFDVALSFLVIGGYVDWTIGAAVVGYGAASVWLTLRANKVTSAYLKRAQHNSDEASNLLGNVLTNLVSLRVFRGIDWVVAANDRYFRRSRQGWTDFYRRRVGFGALQGVLIVVQYVAVFGLLLWREGTAQLAQVVVLVMVLSQLNRPFELIATALREFAVARSMAAPLQDLLDAHAPVQRVGRVRVPVIVPSTSSSTTSVTGTDPAPRRRWRECARRSNRGASPSWWDRPGPASRRSWASCSAPIPATPVPCASPVPNSPTSTSRTTGAWSGTCRRTRR